MNRLFDLKFTVFLKEHHQPIFFIGGFIFDILTLGQIDDRLNIIILSIYLSVIYLFAWKSDWLVRWREDITQFALGALLSAFSLFFFKSGSFANSFIFLSAIFILLVLNEFNKNEGYFQYFLTLLCLMCFFQVITPIAIGRVNIWVFLLSLGLFIGIDYFIRKKIENLEKLEKSQFFAPVLATLFLILYTLKVIPPIPLTMVKAGVYRNLEKSDGQYKVSFLRSPWKFWKYDENPYLYSPGDRIYFYSQIYSPGRFQDEVFIQWEKYSKSGWQTSDRIPVQVAGGRAEGFRLYTFKENITEGEWRVLVKTSNDLEIGRYKFSVITGNQEDNLIEKVY